MKAAKKEKSAFAKIGGSLPPPPTKAEMKAMSKAKPGVMPGKMKAKPMPKPTGKKSLPERVTGMGARKKMLEEFKKK